MAYTLLSDSPAATIKSGYTLLPDADPKEENGVTKNVMMGALKGASDIGATLLTPIDWTLDKLRGHQVSNDERRAALKQFFSENADTDSYSFKGGDLAAGIAGTAGVGGVLGKVAGVIPMLSKTALPAALESGGLMLGKPNSWKAADVATRIGGGATTGAVTAGLVSPDDAMAGASIGSAIPVVGKIGGEAGRYVGQKMSDASMSLMTSALKPILAAQRSGDSSIAARTMLDNGLNVSKGGVEKLRSMIDDLNTQIEGKITYSPSMILKDDVLEALKNTRTRFGNQVSPSSDLSAIDAVERGFRNHPNLPSDFIPVQQAQEMKQGTYGILRGKYGQLGSAETEAQKAIARGLKDEIANAVPGVAQLNAQETNLIKTLGVAERRVLMDLNKNPMGLAALAQNPVSWAAFMADRSATFKSMAARMVNQTANTIGSQRGLLDVALKNPAIRTGLLTGQTLNKAADKTDHENEH